MKTGKNIKITLWRGQSKIKVTVKSKKKLDKTNQNWIKGNLLATALPPVITEMDKTSVRYSDGWLHVKHEPNSEVE